MEIKQFVWDVVDSNSWLIIEDNHGLLIDTIDSLELYEVLSKLESLTVILTHSHFDHIIGLNYIRAIRKDVKVISTKLCCEYLGNIHRNMSSSATAFMAFYSGRNDIQIEPFTCDPTDEVFDDEYAFEWNGHRIGLSAFHGHSSDSLIALMDNKIMFSGDTVLQIPTVTRFPSGSTARFWREDIPRLKEMNSELLVYPGHGNIGRLLDMIALNKEPERYRKR